MPRGGVAVTHGNPGVYACDYGAHACDYGAHTGAYRAG